MSRSRPLPLLLLCAAVVFVLLPTTSRADSLSRDLALKKIRIPLYQRQYIQVQVGIPGRVLTLRLRWDIETTFLYETPYTYSNTFGADGSDLFFLSPQIPPVRIPVVYGQEPSQLVSPYLPHYNGLRQDTSGGVQYNGVLGMGPESFVWRYWSSYTLSKFTLILGGFDDLDVLSGGARIESPSGFGASIGCLGPVNGTLALDFDPEEDFTFIPLRIWPSVSQMLFRSSDHRISNVLYPTHSNGSRSGSKALVFWMSSSSSVIVTSYGGPEMALRIAEREGKDSRQMTLGRIHLLEDFVYYQDKVTGLEIVHEVFDTFPAAQDGQSSESFLSLLALLLWSWWSLELISMVYQWTAYGLFPRVRGLCNELRNADLSWISTVENKMRERRRAEASREQQQQKQQKQPKSIGDLLNDDPACEHPSSKEKTSYGGSLGVPGRDQRILSTGPLDWNMIACMLFLTRMLCFWTIYCSMWGFKSARFAEHLAKLAYLSPLWGKACYYVLLGFVAVAPVAVNTFFIRRYTYAGTVLIQMALICCIWINRLPETTSLFFSLIVNLIFSTLLVMRAVEWLSWCLFRGPDSALSMNVGAVHEYPSERDMSTTNVTTLGRLRETVGEISSALDRGTPLPTTHRDASAAASRTTTQAGPEVSDRAMLQRSASRRYTAGEVVLAAVWALVLLPCACIWAYALNVLPMIENIFPTNPLREWIAVFYLLGVAVMAAWCAVCRTYLQILQQGVVEIREALIELSVKMRQQRSLLEQSLMSE